MGTAQLFAQDDDEPVSPPVDEKPVNGPEEIPPFKASIRGAFKLPNAMANNTFKKVLNGVSNIELSYVQPFLKNFYFGAGIQHSYYDINRFSFVEVTHGNLQSFLGFGEIGFQKYMTDKWYYVLGLRGGYSEAIVRCENCDAIGEKPSQESLYSEAIFGIYLQGNERMSYGMLLSYQLYNFQFGPSWICRTSLSGLTDKDYTGISQSLTVGFGFTCILGKME